VRLEIPTSSRPLVKRVNGATAAWAAGPRTERAAWIAANSAPVNALPTLMVSQQMWDQRDGKGLRTAFDFGNSGLNLAGKIVDSCDGSLRASRCQKI
jgi:hypothetical protein